MIRQVKGNIEYHKKRCVKDVLFKFLGIVLVISITWISQAYFSGFVNLIKGGSFYLHERSVKLAASVFFCLLNGLSVWLLLNGKYFLFRSFFLLLVIITALSAGVFYCGKSGFTEKISDAEKLTEYLKSFGIWSVLVLFFVEFFAVLFLPVPDIVTASAAVVLFGPFFGAIISFLGAFCGSLAAFFIGRKFGVGAVGFFLGKDNLQKGLSLIKGKDKTILAVMLVLPFFPDDLLCFVSGLSSMSVAFFVIIVFIARIISCFVSAYALSGAVLSLKSPIALFLCVLILLLTGVVFGIVCKKIFNKRKKV